MKNVLEEFLLSTPGCINFSDKPIYEVKPDKFSPIYVDIKATLSDVSTRQRVTDKLTQISVPHVDYICGVESGGSYYASSVADRLGEKLILFRTKSKLYGAKKHIVGEIPKKGEKILIIDDVLATGKTVGEACEYFKNLGAEVFVRNVFSYGFDFQVSDKLGVDVKSASYFDNLVEYAINESRIDETTLSILKNYLSTYVELI